MCLSNSNHHPSHHLTEDSIKRESGRKVQLENVKAAKAIADVIRTSLGPRAMLKVGGGVAQ